MHQKVALIFTFFFFNFYFFSFSQKEINSYVFSIRVTANKNNQSIQIIQTGFRLKGLRGIVTALHGVAGAQDITAVNETGSVYLKLKIIQADINRDVAILYSEKMGALPLSGFIPIDISQIASKENLKVIGHPQGIGLITKSVTAGTPVIKQLNSLIPPDKSNLFAQRNSPNPSINVIYIEGSLVPGHSGSPILNTNNNIIGIVNGGILGGAAGISWAIPIADVSFGNGAIDINKIDRLGNSMTGLFDFENLDSPVSSKTKQYSVDYFEITGVQTIKQIYQLKNLDSNQLVGKKIEAASKKSIRMLAKNEVLSYLAGDAGSRAITKVMTEFWKLNTCGQRLTFPLGTSINDLRQWTHEDAIEKYSLGLNYDERLCKIQNIDDSFRYSDHLNKYKGTIKDVTLEFTFVAAICSARKHGLYSEEELDSLETNWTKFVIWGTVKQ